MADYGLAGLCLSLIEVAASQLAAKYADAASTGLHYYLASYILPLISCNKEKNLCLSVDPETILAAHTYGSLIHISLRVILGCLQSQAMTDKVGRILIPVPRYKKTLSSRAFLPILPTFSSRPKRLAPHQRSWRRSALTLSATRQALMSPALSTLLQQK